jgi:hypothetical protein
LVEAGRGSSRRPDLSRSMGLTAAGVARLSTRTEASDSGGDLGVRRDRTQDLLRRRLGVLPSRVGYSGGETPNATYRNHGDHAEAVEVVFDPEMISFRELLKFFFQIHNSSTANRQGNDVGRS